MEQQCGAQGLIWNLDGSSLIFRRFRSCPATATRSVSSSLSTVRRRKSRRKSKGSSLIAFALAGLGSRSFFKPRITLSKPTIATMCLLMRSWLCRKSLMARVRQRRWTVSYSCRHHKIVSPLAELTLTTQLLSNLTPSASSCSILTLR